MIINILHAVNFKSCLFFVLLIVHAIHSLNMSLLLNLLSHCSSFSSGGLPDKLSLIQHVCPLSRVIDFVSCRNGSSHFAFILSICQLNHHGLFIVVAPYLRVTGTILSHSLLIYAKYYTKPLLSII